MTEKTSETIDDCRNELKCIGLRIAYSKALDVELSVLTDLSDMSKSGLGEFVRDMKQTFAEMKELNAELDVLMRQMNNLDDLD